MINRDEFECAVAEFIGTRDSYSRDEWYGTPKEMSKDVLDEFIQWYWALDIAKAERYKQYLKLKEEFENGN